MLKKTDPQIAKSLAKEINRQRQGLELIPSENFVSEAVLEALGSPLTNKYSEGYVGKRYYGGNQFIDEIETLAIERAKKLFYAEHVNVQPYSGSPANLEIYFSLLQPGDTIMGMNLAHGGHLTHGHKVNLSGRIFNFVQYGVNPKNHLIDYKEVEKLAKKYRPKIIICGATAYPRIIKFKKFAEIAKKVKAVSMADIAHLAGLIIGGVHPNPFPFIDIVTTTTHKTLRGPRGAMIMCKKEYAEMIDKTVFPGFQGGPHNHTTAAIAVALKEASLPNFKKYARQIVKNAKTLAQSLKDNNLTLISGGTDNHLILVDLTKTGVTGKQAEKSLEAVGIYVNKNMIPYDQRTPFNPSGIRLGTPALTTRGFKEKEMKIIGQLISQVVYNPENPVILKKTARQVKELARSHPLYSKLKI
ncbi:MAG: serine hydroxymethyltransferase [Patescibacteria group bacterium]|nr:serine hydroxymethyltransferase [Patescibacteria group bacterium]